MHKQNNNDLFQAMADKLRKQLPSYKELNMISLDGTSKMILRKETKDDRLRNGKAWFTDPENPQPYELNRFARMKDAVKSIRCHVCSEQIKYGTIPVKPKHLDEDYVYLCRDCKASWHEKGLIIKDKVIGNKNKKQVPHDKKCPSCDAVPTITNCGNYATQHAKNCGIFWKALNHVPLK